MMSNMYSPPNLRVWRPRVQVSESSYCQTWLLKLCVTILFPMLVNMPVPAWLGVPPPKSRPKRPINPAGFEFGIPSDVPKFPTEESQDVPVFKTMWFQPKRMSFTRVFDKVCVQSPTVLQIGPVTSALPSKG